MSPYFRNSRTVVKLGSLAMVFLLSFCLYGLYCINTVKEVKINGPYYKRIVEGKDVIADILPPPEYLIEAYLTAFQMFHNRNPGDLAALIAQSGRLKAEYLARHAYWEAALREDALKKGLVRDSYAPAQRMLEAIDGEFIPAIKAGDNAKAESILDEKIQPAYREHRGYIDKVVELAKKRNQDDEARAAVAVDSRTYGQIALGLFLFFLLSIYSSYVIQQVEVAGPDAPDQEPAGKAPKDPASRIRA
ncbi:MAG: putative methyl-accepting chemotaxis protein [Fibrobacteres bacterium]|nr:putative methyl-accepting chemotaxis protein [Fibrobacterota bacterium]